MAAHDSSMRTGGSTYRKLKELCRQRNGWKGNEKYDQTEMNVTLIVETVIALNIENPSFDEIVSKE